MSSEAFAMPSGAPLATLPASLALNSALTEAALTYGASPGLVATLIECDVYDEGLTSVVTKKWSDRGLIYPDNSFYEARLMSRVTISQSAVDTIGLGGRVALTVSAVDLYNGDTTFDTIARDGDADGRKVVVKTMPAPSFAASDAGGGSLAGASVVFTGVASSLTPNGTRMVLAMSDFSDRLNVPLQPNLYGGTGGTDGTPDLKGQPKPVRLGWSFNFTPVYIGLVDLGDGAKPTYQSNWRDIRSHEAVRERGVAMSKVFVAPGVGQWRDWPAVGCFQLGFTPNGIVTCDCFGDLDAGSIYAGTTDAVIKRILTSLGPMFSTSDIDDPSFARVASKMVGEIGWGIGAQAITALAAVDDLLSHCGVWLGGNRAGKWRLALAAPKWADIQLTMDEEDIVSLKPVALPSQFVPTPQAVEVVGPPNWTPLTDIAGSVTGAERDALAGSGRKQRVASSVVATRQLPQNTFSLPGLFRYEADALVRAQQLSDWLAGGLRGFEIVTDRYRNQVELGHTASISSYSRYGLGSGFTGAVVAWSESPATGRVTMTLIG
jgi:hypothetical protein